MTWRQANPENRPARSEMAAILLLSLLWAFGALRRQLLPASFPLGLPALATQAVPLALLALAAGTWAAIDRMRLPHLRQMASALILGIALFALPPLLLQVASSGVVGLQLPALLTLTPVFAVALEPHLGYSEGQPMRLALPASLAASLGALLLFPLAPPRTLEACASLASGVLAAACIAAGTCRAVAVFRQLQAGSRVPFAAFAALSPATCLGIASLWLEPRQGITVRALPDLAWALAVELPSLALLFWLLGRLSARRLTARFLLQPLLAVLGGAILLQIALSPRSWVGLSLLAAGAGYLLLAPEAEPAPFPKLL